MNTYEIYVYSADFECIYTDEIESTDEELLQDLYDLAGDWLAESEGALAKLQSVVVDKGSDEPAIMFYDAGNELVGGVYAYALDTAEA